MNFEFFVFLVFMSIVSFAIAFLAYGMVIRFIGKEGWLSKISQIILVPACIVFFDFIVFASPAEYRYIIGSLPLLLVAVIFVYYRFVRGEDFTEAPAPSEAAKKIDEPKKFSKKSARIHAARKNRGRE